MTKKTERPAGNPDAKDSVANPSGELISTKHGLYRRLANGKPGARIAGRLRILARACDIHETSFSRLIEVANGKERPTRLLVPENHLSENFSHLLFSALNYVGYYFSDTRVDRAAIRHHIRNHSSHRYATIVRANGYVDEWAYLLGIKVIGANSERYVLDPTVDADVERHQAYGKLADWQREIVDIVTGNTLCMLAIMASFVGPLIKPLGLGHGGIQFYGDSSQGKTWASRVRCFGDRAALQWSMCHLGDDGQRNR
jgi:putative DNA primase/helicase